MDIDSIHDPVERRGMESQINEFGQTPKQLFIYPHEPRVRSFSAEITTRAYVLQGITATGARVPIQRTIEPSEGQSAASNSSSAGASASHTASVSAPSSTGDVAPPSGLDRISQAAPALESRINFESFVPFANHRLHKEYVLLLLLVMWFMV